MNQPNSIIFFQSTFTKNFSATNPYLIFGNISDALTLLDQVEGTWRHITPYDSYIVSEIKITDDGDTTGKLVISCL